MSINHRLKKGVFNDSMNTRNNSETINSILEISHSAIEHTKNFEKCLSNINNYNRSRAWQCLQEMIMQYSREITTFGILIDRTHIIYNVDFNTISDDSIIIQLKYIANRILFYALIREYSRKTGRLTYDWFRQTSKHY